MTSFSSCRVVCLILLTLLWASLLNAQESGAPADFAPQDPDGNSIPADSTLQDPDGNSIPVDSALQDPDGGSIPADFAPQDPDGNSIPADFAPQDPDGNSTAGDLRTQSLELDIATSGHGELRAWCTVLDLPDDGDEAELRRRLREYYGIIEASGGSEESTASVSGTRVLIESAQHSEYFIMDVGSDAEETIIRLTGGVIISVDESDRNRTHRVEAELVVFNKDTQTISAVGDIHYTVITDDREEQFTGESLTFKVTDWTGVIFQGTSEREEEIDGTTMSFFFRGDSIKQSGKDSGRDILIMEDGTITSHQVENPYYSLKAKKIWITGPGEWGVLFATLYVGHVPVFWLPFYWKSGGDLIFNPVLGYRSWMGYYLQTTTYLLGRKEEDDDFSMLGFGDSSSSNYTLVREGLYLVRRAGGGEKPKNTLKMMVDFYLSMGGMAGLVGDFPSIGQKGSSDFYLSVAFSRSIDDDGNPHFIKDNQAQFFWNKTKIGTETLPIRWGADVNFKWDEWDVEFNWYSDPYYMLDFGERKEDFDWLTFLLSEEGSGPEDQEEIKSLKWSLSGSHSFRPQVTAPWLESVRINKFQTYMQWGSDANAEVTAAALPDQSFNPARRYFYPEKIILPDLQISLDGGAPPLEVERRKPPKDQVGEEEPGPPPDEDEIEDDALGLQKAQYHRSIDTGALGHLLRATLDYGLESKLFVEGFFDRDGDSSDPDDDWDSPDDIEFDLDPLRINTTHRFDITYGMEFWDELIGFRNKNYLWGDFQTHADAADPNALIDDAIRLEDYKYSRLLWGNDFTASLRPLIRIRSLSESSLEYSFDGTLFTRTFAEEATVDAPSYENQWIDPDDEEYILTHEATALLRWIPSPFLLSFSALADIPPLDEKYNFEGEMGFNSQGFDIALSQEIDFAEDEWTFEPLTLTASWTGWKDEVTVSQKTQFDVEEKRFTSSESFLRFWGFEARFVADYGKSYTWSKTEYKWEDGPENFAPSRLSFAFKRIFEPAPMWKNRIRIKTDLKLSWNINLRRPTDNVLAFKWVQEVKIYKFLDFRLSFSSTNKSMFLYFPGWRDQLGLPEVNFFDDLGRALNIFSEADRRNTQFIMDRVEVSLVHHLRNWDLFLEYSGWPTLEDNQYKWKDEFSVFVKWNPLPMFNQRTKFEDNLWEVESFESDS